MPKRVSKLDNLIVIFYCMFLGSCFHVTPNKSYFAEKSLEKCVNPEDKDDCEKFTCPGSSIKNNYKGSYREPSLHTLEKNRDMNFRCNEDVLDM